MKRFLTICLIAFPLIAYTQPKDYSIVFLNAKPDADKLPKATTDSIMKGHFANMGRLSNEGKLLAAGPFDGGGGIFIMNTTSEDEVREWISPDPGVKMNRWKIEILPYKVRHGGICPVKEPYNMVDYTFVRFDAVVSKYNAATHGEIMTRHHDFLKSIKATGNVVAEGLFSELDGGVLVIKGEVDPTVLETDPAVKEGLASFKVKKLYIAQGSFCEQ